MQVLVNETQLVEFVAILRRPVLGVVQIVNIPPLLGSKVRTISQLTSGSMKLYTNRLRLVFTRLLELISSPIACSAPSLSSSRLWDKQVGKTGWQWWNRQLTHQSQSLLDLPYKL